MLLTKLGHLYVHVQLKILYEQCKHNPLVPFVMLLCPIPITVLTPEDFVFYLRFSVEFGTTLSIELVSSTVETEVVSFVDSE